MGNSDVRLNKSGPRVKVAVIGVGNFAQGLVSLALRSGAQAKYAFCFGSRRVSKGSQHILPGLEKSPVCNIDDALTDSDIVILALPANSIMPFITSCGAQLAHKIVVDVMNPWSSDLKKLSNLRNQLMPPADTESQADKPDASKEPNRPSSDSAAGTSVNQPEIMLDAINNRVKDVEVDIESLASSDDFKPIANTSAWLANMLPASAHVVKAFCNLSAYALIHGDPLTEHMKSVAASDSVEAADAVAELGRALGLEMRAVYTLTYATALEARQRSLLKTWQWPALLMVATWVVVHIYSFIRYNYYGGSPWQSVTMWILNKSVGWVSLWGMVYTYLPGVLVCYMQLISRQPSLRLPNWLKVWMDGRKQLGLLALAAMLLHLLLSTFLWMPSYYSKLWDNTDATITTLPANATAVDIFGVPKGFSGTASAATGHMAHASISNSTLTGLADVRVNNIVTIRSKLNWIGESSTFLGIISGCLMGLIALTSLPSVTPKLNWREWRLLQSQAGWLAVVTATVHVLLLGASWWPRYKTDWPKMIPTITLMSTIPPMVLLLLKGLISLPPLSWVLRNIRSGRFARKVSNARAVSSTPVYAVCHK